MHEYEPVLAEVCVKGVIFNSEGQVLLLRRSRESKIDAGSLDLPGGMLEEGEVPVDGLKREVKEETDLGITEIDPVYTYGAIPSKIGQYTVWIWYSAKTESTNVTLDHENSEFEWMEPSEAIALEDESFPKVHKEAIKRTIGS